MKSSYCSSHCLALHTTCKVARCFRMSDVEISRQKPLDGGWGWMIVLATFIVTALGAGNIYSIGVLFVAFLDAFGRSKADTSWISLIFIFCFAMSSSTGIALARKLGHRKTIMIAGFMASCGILGSSFATELYHLYITYGIVTGTSLGLTYTVGIEMVSIYFKRKLMIALGLAFAGSGAGQLILSVFTQFLVETYGWRGALIILSAFESNMCVAGALFRPLTTEVNTPTVPESSPQSVVETITHHEIKDSKLDSSDECFHDITTSTLSEVTVVEEEKKKEDSILWSVKAFLKTVFGVPLLKKPIFRCLIFIAVGYGFSEIVLVMHVVRRARDFGIGDTQSAYLPAVMGLIQLIGRPLVGAIGNIPCVKAHMLVGAALALCGALTVVSTYIKSYAAQLLYAGIVGLCIGGYFVGLPLTVTQFLGHENIGLGTSVLVQILGIVSLASGPFAGWIRDKYGVYDIAYWTVGLVLMLTSAVVFALPSIDRSLQRGCFSKAQREIEE
ncbi:monocarboxylate transporter 13-like isoform X3 [Ptychodera flava]|uniref:monocarboxylate transporter 13-like isoform X3 n=1 Tax=Ptychodera flava TaxID=63121 RepID=UPI00396A9C65